MYLSPAIMVEAARGRSSNTDLRILKWHQSTSPLFRRRMLYRIDWLHSITILYILVNGKRILLKEKLSTEMQ
jgi:hypothetical protein